MTLKTSFIIGLAVAALTGVQAASAQRMSDASDRAQQATVAAYPDAIERAVFARENASRASVYPDAVERAMNAKLTTESTVSNYPDAIERAVGGRVESGPLPGHTDRYELDLPNGPVSAPSAGSGRDIEWPQLGIGFLVGVLLVLGLILGMRFTRSRPLAHG